MPSFLLTGHSHLSCMLKAHRQDPEGFKAGGQAVTVEFMWLQAKAYQPNLTDSSERENDSAPPAAPQKLVRLLQRAKLKLEREKKAAAQGGFKPMQGDETGLRFTDQLRRQMRNRIRKTQPDWVIATFMGNEYNALALPQHPQPFDFHWPEMDFTVRDDAQVLPFELVKAQIRELSESHTLVFLRELRSLHGGPIAVLPPPPPIGDEDHIRKYPARFDKRIEKFGVSPADFRLKMYMLFVLILREEAEALGMTMLDLPFDIYEDGFLKPCYRQNDPTHGNPAYGAVVLRHALDTLAKKSG